MLELSETTTLHKEYVRREETVLVMGRTFEQKRIASGCLLKALYAS